VAGIVEIAAYRYGDEVTGATLDVSHADVSPCTSSDLGTVLASVAAVAKTPALPPNAIIQWTEVR